ncbi:MAG TPA: DNA-binding protein [Streptosporangiaceae bacterium]|nr:DNA-binding protein [Streptosporangiaceae bacterium]
MVHEDDDYAQAASETDARARLLQAGASSLPRAPWLHERQPPPAVDLTRFAAWRAASDTAGEEVLLAALTLLSAARAEGDQTEAALLFAARAQGLSWSRISRAMGLGSPQAAQQRLDRVAGRVRNPGSP